MILAGDIGGTKTNLALFGLAAEPTALSPTVLRSYPSGQHATFSALIAHYLAEVGQHASALTAACFGIAGPVFSQRCEATNLPWVIDAAELGALLGIPSVWLLNDLEATGYGIATLTPSQIEQLNASQPVVGSNAALIAAGTGLGEAILLATDGGFRPIAGEGSHCDFAPRNELEIELLRYLLGEFEHVSYEHVVSGPGLRALYRFFSHRTDATKINADLRARIEANANTAPAEISSAALESRCPAAVAALDLFVELYAAEAANLALKVNALGGVYFGGGIAPRIASKLREPRFLASFNRKGRFAKLTQQMPLYLLHEPLAALRGAAAFAAKPSERRGSE
ncbi:MAG: glucokinase [Deltaproteobacteria bacterium]|nr:glucokinase [Deltaproteobacteria bacterium]